MEGGKDEKLCDVRGKDMFSMLGEKMEILGMSEM